MTVQLLGVGASAPRRRVAAADVAAAWGRRGGRGHAAVCPADEDTLTLAWEAGTAALTAAGIDPQHVDACFWGTARPPFAEGPSQAVLSAALGCSTHVAGTLSAGSTHAGMDALTAAADAIAAGSAQIALGDRFRRAPAGARHVVRTPLRRGRSRDRAGRIRGHGRASVRV